MRVADPERASVRVCLRKPQNPEKAEKPKNQKKQKTPKPRKSRKTKKPEGGFAQSALIQRQTCVAGLEGNLLLV